MEKLDSFSFKVSRKGLIKITKYSSLALLLFLLGFFLLNTLSVFAGLQGTPPAGQPPVWINVSTTDANQTDDFFTCANVVYVRSNITCTGGVTVCNETVIATANFTSIGGGWRQGVNISGVNGLGGWRLFEFNDTVNCAATTIRNFQMANITVNASTPTDSSTDIGWAGPILVNMSNMPGCPPADANVQIPMQVPLMNGSFVNTTGQCITTCSADDVAQVNHTNSTGTFYNLCGPTFSPSSLNLTQVAYNGNFSAVTLVLDIPGKVKINFTTPVNFSDQQKASAVMEFAMKNMMSGGRVGINDTEWNGTGGKPDLRLSARLTIYNISGRMGISQPHMPIISYRATYGSGNFGACGTNCSGIVWDGENLTFTVSSFSEYQVGSGLSVVIQTPANFSYVGNSSFVQGAPFRNINFTFVPTWNDTTTPRNVTLFGNFTEGGSWTANATNSTPLVNATLNGINFTVPADRAYLWNIVFYDTTGSSDTNTNNYTVTVDTVEPKYSAISTTPFSPTAYSPGKNYIFNITWNDTNPIGKVIFEWNATTNYTSATTPAVQTVTSTNYSLTLTDLGVSSANYTYKWYANDSANNFNVTATQTFNVTQNTTNPINIYLNGSTSNLIVTYPAQVNATALAVYSNSGTVNIYRNGTDKTSENNTNVRLENATYEYKFNMTGNANYTNNGTDATYYVFVNKGDPNSYINLYIDNATSDKTIIYPATAEVRGNISTILGASDLIFNLYRNNTPLGAGNITNQTVDSTRLGNATYVFNYNTTGGGNWTSGAATSRTLYVNKGTVTINLALNVTEANTSYTYPQAVNATGWKSSIVESTYNISLWRDGVIVDSSTTTSSVSQNILLGNNTYNYTLTFTSTNYSDTSITNNRFVLVNKGNHNILIYVNGSGDATYTAEKGSIVNITVVSNATIDNVISAMQIYTNYTGSNATIVNLTGSGNGLYNITNTSQLSVGNYTISANASTTANYSSAANNTIILFVKDGTTPTITSFTLTKTGYIYTGDTLTSSDFSCTATDNDSPLTISITGLSTSTTGTKTASCTVTDPSGNSGNATVSYTVYGYSAPAPSTPSTTATQVEIGRAQAFIQSIAANGVGTVTISKDTETNVNEIKIAVVNKATAVSISIVKLAEKPADISAPSATTFTYININLDVPQSNLKTSTIKFQVPKTWIQQNNIDTATVSLNRYANNQWSKLTTTKLSDDADNVYYEAETPGFSYFAISGEKLAEVPAPTPEQPAPPAEEVPAPTAPPAPTPTSLLALVLIIAVVLLFLKFGMKKR